MAEKLYKNGEVLDCIREGYYAISIAEEDKGTIIGIDEKEWLFVIPSHRKYKNHNLNFKFVENIQGKRYALRKLSAPVIEMIEDLNFLEEELENLFETMLEKISK